MKLSEISSIVEVDIARDGQFNSLGFVTHNRPEMLVFLEDQKYLESILSNPNIVAVIASAAAAGSVPENYQLAVTSNPRISFYNLHNHLANKTEFYWTNFKTTIDKTAQIHPRAFVAESNVKIGARTIIEAGANILERSIIGEDVIIRAGVTIGSQGFQFERTKDGVMSIAHAGGAQIGDRVEIMANSAISRPVFGGFTSLGDDTKLDNLVHVAHDVTIGKRSLLAASAMIAGSVTIGDDVWIGPAASISSEIKIGDRANITIGSVVTRDVASGQHVTGNFAVDHKLFIEHIKRIVKG